MNRTISLLFFLLSVMCSHAAVDCTDKMIEAQDLFGEKKFEKAKELFSSISNDSICGKDYKDVCVRWIKRCEKGIVCANQMNEAEILWREKRFEDAKKLFFSISNDSICGELYKDDCSLWIKRCDEGVSCAQEMEDAKKLFYEEKYEKAKKTFSSIFNDSICGELYKSDCENWIKKCNSKIHSQPITEAPSSVQKSESSGSENIAIHIVSSDKNSHIATRIKTWLTESFNNAGKNYKVQENDDELDEFLKKYENPSEKGGDSGNSNTQGKKPKLDKVCYVRINDINDDLQFDCRFIDVDSVIVEKIAVYPRPNMEEDIKVTSLFDVNMVQWVSNILAWQLGLLSEEQQKELENRIEQFRKKDAEAIKKDSKRFCDSIKKMIREDEILALCPGRYQRYYGQETKDYFMKTRGYLYPVLEGISVIGIFGSALQIRYNENMGRKTTDPVDREHYNRRNKTIWVPALGGSIGAAVLVYLINIGDAHYSIRQAKNAYLRQAKNAGTICINPVITDESIILTLNINF